MDLLLSPRQYVLRRDVADSTVQADVVVMLDVTSDYMTLDNLVNSGRAFVQAFTDVIVQRSAASK